MKKIIFLFYIILLLPRISKAQYISTAIDSAVWLVGCDYNQLTGQYNSRFFQYINGDTTINNIQYYKVYSGLNDSLEMLIRDNISTNTVHAIFIQQFFSSCTPLTDVVLLDFNPLVTPGASTANCSGSHNVFSIDTVNLYGMDRRRFWSDFGEWIEGIGNSTLGLASQNTSFCSLINYCRGTPEDCGAYAWVSTKNIRTYQQGKLYPNPARKQSKLELEAYLEDGKIQLYNLLGQLQYEQYFSGQEAILDVSNLNQGMYMIQVFDDEQLVFGEKLLVID